MATAGSTGATLQGLITTEEDPNCLLDQFRGTHPPPQGTLHQVGARFQENLRSEKIQELLVLHSAWDLRSLLQVFSIRLPHRILRRAADLQARSST